MLPRSHFFWYLGNFSVIANVWFLLQMTIDDLSGIWEWNAHQRGINHANSYIAFLKAETLKLTRALTPGRPVPTRKAFRYTVIKRRRQGHGHLVVFMLDERVLRVLRYYHTSQNWQKGFQ
jgi:plasmid stabilization system protein ParE